MPSLLVEPDDEFESEDVDFEEYVGLCGHRIPRVCPESVTTKEDDERECRDGRDKREAECGEF